MKVCLISPPTLSEFNERQVASSEAHRLIAEHAPMGVLSLAAVLDGRGLTPHIVDLNRLNFEYFETAEYRQGEGSFAEHVIRYLEATPFDVFGFSSICSTYPLTLRIAERVKLIYPEAKIVIGGPQASVVDVQTLKAFPFVDAIVRGEAEETFPLLLESLSVAGFDAKHIGGITYRHNGDVVRNPNTPPIADLDSLPMPAFHLYPYIESCSYAPLEAGRGCPFACSFCSTNDFFRRRFRMKSPHVLVHQMKLIKETYGIDNFNLIHDMFTVDRKKVVAFCDAIEESGEKLYWTCSARTDCVDAELISRMARSGCIGLYFGVDTGSERIQAIINKGLDMDEAASNIRQATRHGIDTTVSMITGFPEETREDLRQTAKFAAEMLRYPQAEIQLHLLAPLAETPITTCYREQLIYDEIFSDMSLQGWEQYPEDRELIVAHRDIFTNFYAIPTRWLDRHYLKEFREFLLKGVVKHRWLMLFLHQDCGDLLCVFDAWRFWTPTGKVAQPVGMRGRHYYASDSFSHDLLEFTRTQYAQEISRHPHLATTMATVEAALLLFHEGDAPACARQPRRTAVRPNNFSADAVPVRAGGVRVVQVEANYKRLLRCLKRKERHDRIPAEPFALALLPTSTEIRVLQLNPLTHHLLCLCDGARRLKEVADSFSITEKIDGISTTHASLYGLAALANQGLIDIKAAAA